MTKYKGVIVWDFDGVLFEMGRYGQDNRRAYINLGIPEKIILDIRAGMRKRQEHFSVSRFTRELRKKRVDISERKIHQINHSNLKVGSYYSSKTDEFLHRLNKKGFRQMILSMGNARYQRKKMFFGCSKTFPGHFLKIMITTRPKYSTLLKIQKKYRGTPLIFIDDTKENLELAKKHVPGIKTIYYSNLSGKSLAHLEKDILSYAEK